MLAADVVELDRPDALDVGACKRCDPAPAEWNDGRMSDYQPAEDRYDTMDYRYTGRSGLKLPALSLGLWQNFGTDRPEETQRAILRRAFDRGVTHFDLANNYGPPYGRAEENFGRFLRHRLRRACATSW